MHPSTQHNRSDVLSTHTDWAWILMLNRSHIIAIRSEYSYTNVDRVEIDKACRVYFEENPVDLYSYKWSWYASSDEGKSFLTSLYAQYTKVEYHIIKDSQGQVYTLRPFEYQFL